MSERQVAEKVFLWPDGRIPLQMGTEPERLVERTPNDGIVRLTDVNRPYFRFFRTPRKGACPVVVVMPGGGDEFLAWNLEGAEVAAWLNTLGCSAAVLAYRVPNQREAAPCDAQRTVGLLRHKAGQYGVDPHKVGVIGFSAGANLAVRLSTNWRHRAYAEVDAADDYPCRPDFQMVIYPWDIRPRKDALSADGGWEGDLLRADYPVDGETPPAFVVQAEDDWCESATARAYDQALRQSGVASETRIYVRGGHGFGLRKQGKPSDKWPLDAAVWLQRVMSGGFQR